MKRLIFALLMAALLLTLVPSALAYAPVMVAPMAPQVMVPPAAAPAPVQVPVTVPVPAAPVMTPAWPSVYPGMAGVAVPAQTVVITPVTRYLVPVYSGYGGHRSGVGGYTAYLTAANGKNVNVRQYPGKQYQRIGSYPVGTPVTVLACLGEWSQVAVGGVQGYVMSCFLTPAAVYHP